MQIPAVFSSSVINIIIITIVTTTTMSSFIITNVITAVTRTYIFVQTQHYSKKIQSTLAPQQNLGSSASFLRDPSAPLCPSLSLRVPHFHNSSSSPSSHSPHSGAGFRHLGPSLQFSHPSQWFLMYTPLFKIPSVMASSLG